MEIKLFVNDNATRKIKRLNIKRNMFIEQWYLERKKMCYILYKNKVPITFALISVCDFDPKKIHTNPKVLNYIFTFEKYRRKKYALTLISFIKKYNEITVFCSNEASENLFKRAKYLNYGYLNNVLMFRYP